MSRTPLPRSALCQIAALLALVGLGCGRQPAEPVGKSPARVSANSPGRSGNPGSNPETAATAPAAGRDRQSSIPAAGSADIVPRFTDVARPLGIDYQFHSDTVPGRYFLPEIMCGGLAWFDPDLDGWHDLFIANGTRLKDPDPADITHTQRYFHNRRGARFDDQSAASGLNFVGYSQGTAVGDFDADGFPDLCVTGYGAVHLFRNNGDGTFSEVTSQLPARDPLWSTGAVWGDFDADGELDLYVANYMHVNWQTHKTCTFGGKPGYCGPGDYESQPDWLFLNQGDGGFREAAAELGFVGERGNGLAVAWADLDDDARPELYVANDMAPNFLYTRRAEEAPRGALYQEVASRSGCAVAGNGQNEASMGIALADFDRDGRPDLFLTHYYHHKNTLYHNLGGLLFEDDSYRTRVAAHSHERLGFGTLAFDYDRDGATDLFVANGHVLGPEHEPFEMPASLLRNDGRGRFLDVSQTGGAYFETPRLGRGVAGADFDNDGRLDLAITHLDCPVALLRNETETGRDWMGLDLRTPDRRTPVGARVTVRTASGEQIWNVWDGGSYYSTSDSRRLFGLPAGDSAQVEIRWPDGRTENLGALAGGRYWIVRPDRPPQPWELEQP